MISESVNIKNPHFSICIPVYNGETYLKECIDSAIAQTFTNYEIILSDDCSTDNSYSICEAYKNNNKCIHLFKNDKNYGLAQNLNKAISLAKGQWIKILLQDDLLEKECLEKIYKSSGECNFIWHKRAFIIEENASKKFSEFFNSDLVNKFSQTFTSRYFSKSELANIYCESPYFNFFGEPSNIAFKKEEILKQGLYDKSFKQMLDYEFCLRLTTNIGGYYINEDLSTFRVHGRSASTVNQRVGNFYSSIYEFMMIMHKVFMRSQYKSFRNSVQIKKIIKSYLYLNRIAAIYIVSMKPSDKFKIIFGGFKYSIHSRLLIALTIIYRYTVSPIKKNMN